MFTRRSRNSYIRSRRNVTLQPIGMPSRILKPATDLRASVVTGLLTSDFFHIATGFFHDLLVSNRFTHTHVQRDLGDLRYFHRILQTKLLLDLSSELVLKLFVIFFSVNVPFPLLLNIYYVAVGEDANFLAIFDAETNSLTLLRLRVKYEYVRNIHRHRVVFDATCFANIRVRLNVLLGEI